MRAGAAFLLFRAALYAHSKSRAGRSNRLAFEIDIKSGPQQAADRPNCTETYFVFFGAFAVFVVLAAALAGFSALTSFTARLTGAFASFSTSVRTQS